MSELPRHQQVFDRKLSEFVQAIVRGDIIVDGFIDDIMPICFSYEDYTSNSLSKSPIENQLFAGLLFANNGYQRLKAYSWEYYDCYCNSEGEIDYDAPLISFGTIFIAQAPIKKYRADFLFISHANEQVRKLIVECDGHDFHEKTKQQASKDKKRDRDLMALGIPVLRFTGSDIHHNLDSCVDEISEFLSGQMFEISEPKLKSPKRRGKA